VWYCEQRSSVCRHLTTSLEAEANDCHRRAKRYERLMKANGIHPNGGPSTSPSTTASPAAKSLSKGAIAKAAAAKKRKIEGTPAARIKHDEEDDAVKPKSEPYPRQNTYIRVKAEPVANPGSQFPAANFAITSNPTAIMDHIPLQQQSDSANSIFAEFCVPEMFTKHCFDEAVVKAEQQPQALPPSPQQLCYVPPLSPAVAERFKQSSNGEGTMESGNGPLESIVIAD
jgi:hypothetical protein